MPLCPCGYRNHARMGAILSLPLAGELVQHFDVRPNCP